MRQTGIPYLMIKQITIMCMLMEFYLVPCYLCILVRPKTRVLAFSWRLNCCFMLLHTQGQSECSLLCWLLVRPSLVRTLAAYAFREQRTHNDASLPPSVSWLPQWGSASMHGAAYNRGGLPNREDNGTKSDLFMQFRYIWWSLQISDKLWK